MRHPLEKFIRMEVIAIMAGLFFGIFAWITGWLFFLFFACYLFVFSMFSNALILLHTRRGSDAIKQAIRAVLLFLFITSIYFYL
ncbi:hypothetical protein [Oceanobacillus jeddahense]|uniref:Uncharacterized protein n=1 Tax=Oceanobacillus jeddahense TaxID=1462527 RepID=A0ABY5JQS5_9BACI|nr:hypothetical protein [Oceanobacillus jeddahense]UUI02673.1 hypothetical protein NP439_21985 [Oceanobacillus jeddahense]